MHIPGPSAEAPRGRWPLTGLLILLLLSALPVVAAANPFGAAPPQEAAELNAFERASAWILQTQRDLHRRLTLLMHQLDEAPTARTAGALILASFLYGIFHAAGPGHGKAVISTYLLTHRQSLGRGIWLSTAASLMQGITAIVAVLLLIGLFGWLARDAMGQVRNLELASFLLVALLGLWLIGRGLRSLWRLRRQAPAASRAVAGAASGGTEHGPIVGTQRFSPVAPGALVVAAQRHDEHCGCGTPHHVSPDQRGPWYATVMAVGIRPCSGAVLVMAVSYMLGIAAAGIAAVLAMSLGTALTVSLLATLAVQARDWTTRLVRPTPRAGLRYAGPVAGVVGGIVIFLVGWTLFQGSLAAAPVRHPLGL